jgi:hypothetical protein
MIPMNTIERKLNAAWDHVGAQKLTPIVTLLFGGAVVGSMSNVYPLYISAGATLLGGLLACTIYIPDRVWRLTLAIAWFGFSAMLWILYFHPRIISDGIIGAETALANNTSQCSDIGRKRALEELAGYGTLPPSLEIDCANINGISFPRNAVIRNISITDGKAVGGRLIGVDMWGAILSGADLTNADFTDAVMNGTIFGRFYLSYDRKTGGARCYDGADLTGAKLNNADIRHAWLLGVKGLTCQQLVKTKNWSDTVRDEGLACGAAIPQVSDMRDYDYIKGWFPQKCGGK